MPLARNNTENVKVPDPQVKMITFISHKFIYRLNIFTDHQITEYIFARNV